MAMNQEEGRKGKGAVTKEGNYFCPAEHEGGGKRGFVGLESEMESSVSIPKAM